MFLFSFFFRYCTYCVRAMALGLRWLKYRLKVKVPHCSIVLSSSEAAHFFNIPTSSISSRNSG